MYSVQGNWYKNARLSQVYVWVYQSNARVNSMHGRGYISPFEHAQTIKMAASYSEPSYCICHENDCLQNEILWQKFNSTALRVIKWSRFMLKLLWKVKAVIRRCQSMPERRLTICCCFSTRLVLISTKVLVNVLVIDRWGICPRSLCES
jgi:hypothetical protein